MEFRLEITDLFTRSTDVLCHLKMVELHLFARSQSDLNELENSIPKGKSYVMGKTST